MEEGNSLGSESRRVTVATLLWSAPGEAQCASYFSQVRQRVAHLARDKQSYCRQRWWNSGTFLRWRDHLHRRLLQQQSWPDSLPASRNLSRPELGTAWRPQTNSKLQPSIFAWCTEQWFETQPPLWGSDKEQIHPQVAASIQSNENLNDCLHLHCFLHDWWLFANIAVVDCLYNTTSI